MSIEVETVIVIDEILRLTQLGGENAQVAIRMQSLMQDGYESVPERVPRSEFHSWKQLAKDALRQASLDHKGLAQSMQFNSFP